MGTRGSIKTSQATMIHKGPIVDVFIDWPKPIQQRNLRTSNESVVCKASPAEKQGSHDRNVW